MDTPVARKRCHQCQRDLPASEFWKRSASRDGLQHQCKDCLRTWRRKHDKRLQRLGTPRRRTPDGARRALLKYRYGISVEEWDEMFDAQDGTCKICAKEGDLQVDHDHDTGRVRGLLCWACNTLLGCAADDPARLRIAADYLEVG